MADPRDDDKPPYTLYRAKPNFLRRRRRDDGGLREMQEQRPPAGYEETPPQPQARAASSRAPPARISPFWRVLRWLVTALVAWLAISLVLFLVSAQIQSAQVSDAADAELGRRRLPADLAQHDPRARLRRPHQGLQGARREQDRHAQPLGLDPARARRRRPQRDALDPARHRRQHPRQRPEQDQRRLRDRRPVAGDPHRRGLPRASRSTTWSRSTSRTSRS